MLKKITFYTILPKVMRQQLIGEVGEFITIRCQVSSGCYIPKTIKIGNFFMELFKIERGHF